ncbi:hypothetical protein [Conexibacter sp. SYSU D00693]|uniref:hypothetical protein n=1 Tax=Conexibacter sp. SYSU D00693 TaxID=2812560 RepID=UPI00196A862D|nr:hypothetical protein [Conexibacter sp. SYSU D00693]
MTRVPGDRAGTDELLRALHRRLLSHVLHADEGDLDDPWEDPTERGGLVLLCDGDPTCGTLLQLEAPDPDDHRVAHLARCATTEVIAQSPVAVAVAVTLKAMPDPHETVVVVAAHRDGPVLASAMQAVPTSDGVLAPGPVVELDEVARELPATLLRALQAA